MSKDKGKFCDWNITLNRVQSRCSHTLKQKLPSSTDFIWFEDPFKYMKEFPYKEYGKKSHAALLKQTVHHSCKCPHPPGLLGIFNRKSEQHSDKFNSVFSWLWKSANGDA
jgi:hypothetical protein